MRSVRNSVASEPVRSHTSSLHERVWPLALRHLYRYRNRISAVTCRNVNERTTFLIFVTLTWHVSTLLPCATPSAHVLSSLMHYRKFDLIQVWCYSGTCLLHLLGYHVPTLNTRMTLLVLEPLAPTVAVAPVMMKTVNGDEALPVMIRQFCCGWNLFR